MGRPRGAATRATRAGLEPGETTLRASGGAAVAYGAAATPDGGRPFLPAPAGGYWKHATLLCIAILAIIALRLHEPLAFLRPLRPALLVSIVGGALIWVNSSPAVRRIALDERVLRLVLAYFGWAAITMPFALYKGLVVSSLQITIPATIMTTALLLCPPRRDVLDRISRWFVLSALVMAVALQALGFRVSGRLSGLGSFDPNDLAAVMALCLPFAMGLVVRGPHLWRLVGLAAAAVFAGTAMATSSRGGAIALAVASLVFVLGFPGWKRFALLIVVGIGAAVSWTVAPPDFKERILSMQNIEEDYNYTAFSGRKQVWARARLYIVENPVMGVGMNNFPIREGQYCKEVLGRGCKWSATHNTYLQVGSELGLVGLGIFGFLLFTMARIGWRYWRPGQAPATHGPPMHRPELLAALVGWAAGAYFLSHAYFYPLFGLAGILGLAQLVRRHEQYDAMASSTPGGWAPVMAAPVGGAWRTFRSRGAAARAQQQPAMVRATNRGYRSLRTPPTRA